MHRWKLSALAAAAFASAAMTTTDAAALALGPLRVQSALGENLRAEIAIPQATAAEIGSLVAQIASPEIFRAQGMDYSVSARAIQVQLVRKPDGTASLRLTSTEPLQDPFVDLVIESQWGTGQMVRSYTLLLDPPAARRTAPAAATAPQVAPAAPASVTGSTYSSNNTPRPRPVAPEPAVSAPQAVEPSATDGSTRVRVGDTAGRIANASRPTGVSLDQMLVAMLRSNPDAFINGNVNRIRAGAVLQLPNREQALETSAPEARQIVAAQSRDFNAYRRGMAVKAPQAAVQAADRSSSGQVQAQVSDTRPAADTPDKLTLSKGAVKNAAVAEEKLAAQKQADDQDNRLSELQRNLAELNEIAGTKTTTAQAATAADAPPATPAPEKAPTPEVAAAATPTLDINNATAAAATETANNAAETAPAAATDAATTAQATPNPEQPAATEAPSAETQAAQSQPTPAPTPTTEPSITDELLENPLVPAGAGLVALLLGLLGYSAWKRRRAAQPTQDPILGDSQLPAESFFGGSGGQQVDTSSADNGASTMAYAPSQLDGGGGDVDPVAEADVYLAYGRDVQAEEILKEALRNHPERLSVHVKLAEIYVKRNDIKGLEGVARGLQAASRGQGPEWQRVVEMGRHMDPTNAVFAAAGNVSAASTDKPTSTFAAALNSLQPTASAAAQPMPDLDLHLDLPDAGLASANTTANPALSSAPLPSDDDFAALDLPNAFDNPFDLSAAPAPQDPPTLIQDTLMPEDSSAHDLSGLDLDLSGFEVSPVPSAADSEVNMAPSEGLDFDLDTPAAQPPTPAAPEVPANTDFDLGSLDLDLGPTAEPAAEAQPVHNLADDPLSTKLDLAQEFNAIGDSEGARALIEEVLAEASGPLKDRAQKMLSEID